MTLTEAELDLFDQLTSTTFYVVDTEYTSGPDKDGNHLISIAIVPIVGGVRQSKGALYKVMNPGVPITAASTAIHKFTDGKVKGKKRFSYYAQDIVAAFADPDAVFVCHTAVDIKLLRDELTRMDAARTDDERAAWPALASLPEMPVLDTSTLPRLVKLEGVGHRGSIKLTDLCTATKVKNTNPHDARGDAKATADALIAMFKHVAHTAQFWSLPELLKAHDRGTTSAPKGPQYIRSRKTQDPPLDAAHAALHTTPLDHAGSKAERAALVDLAAQCVALRCQWLRDEMREAAPDNGPELIDPLMKLLPSATEPGQAGTLLGAIAELISATEPGAKPALNNWRALRWWSRHKAAVRESKPCSGHWTEACPSCRAGESCPRDVLYQPVAEIATVGEQGVLDRRRIHHALLPDGSKVGKRALTHWLKPYPEAAAWMMWRVISFERGEGLSAADGHLDEAIKLGLHTVEPRLALLACQTLLPSGKPEEAVQIAEDTLAHRTTDKAYDELATWLLWTQQGMVVAERRRLPQEDKKERLSRPKGRVNANPYSPA